MNYLGALKQRTETFSFVTGDEGHRLTLLDFQDSIRASAEIMSLRSALDDLSRQLQQASEISLFIHFVNVTRRNGLTFISAS